MTLMATQYFGAPYRWGANGPFEFDCSGLAIKVLHDIGYTLPDQTAQGIYEWAIKKFDQLNEPESDTLLFFGKDLLEIDHVAIGVDEQYMIEAGGAGADSLNMTKDQLAHRDARVRMKPIKNRRDFLVAVKIKY